MALGILGAYGGLNKKEISDCLFVGELSLDGGIRSIRVENHDVEVRYDPFDIGAAYAFVKNCWTECHSEHYVMLQGRSEKEIMLASKEVRRRNQLHSRERFTLTARKLADFLESAEAEEKCLLQRLRDRESNSIRQNDLFLIPVSACEQATCGESEPESATPLISVPAQAETTAIYGDF
jgi:putative transposase